MRVRKDFKIFVLDGDLFSLNIYEQHLVNLGYTDISTFNNSVDCFDALSTQPDIIFLDHNINEAAGVDVLKKIKRFNPDIYVIFIAGLDDVEAVVRSLKHGAFDFIVRGDNDVKTLDNVIARVQRIKELLQRNSIGISQALDKNNNYRN
jgi:polysaccharide export outer membrane protein